VSSRWLYNDSGFYLIIGSVNRNGQPWNNTAYIGVSSPTHGTLTLLRQLSLTSDAVLA
jgi:predicted porin